MPRARAKHVENDLMLVGIDVRLAYDVAPNTIIIGCHMCGKFDGHPISEISEIGKMIPTFMMEHLVSCKKRLQ